MSAAARRTWIAVWLLLAAVLLVRAADRQRDRGVILDHLEFGRRLVHGSDVYAPWRSGRNAELRPLHAPYPPSFGLLTAPFALVGEVAGLTAARFAWALLQVLALAATALLLRRLAAPRAPPLPAAAWHWLWLGMFLLGARFVLRDTHGGGGNLINLGLCLGAFAAAESGRPRLAGLLLGISLATKPTQVWLWPVLLLFGHRRAAAWTLVAGAAAVLLTLAMQRFDLQLWLRWLDGSLQIATQADAFADPALDFPKFEWMNQSLRPALHRWLGSVPPDLAARVAWGMPPGLGLPARVVAAITSLCGLLLLATVLLQAHRRRADAGARLWLFAAALVLSLLLSPLCWKAHHVALLPLLFLLLLQAVTAPSRWRWVWLLLWALCCLPGQDMVGDAADEWLNSVYVLPAWNVVLLLYAVRRSGRECPS